MDSRWRLKWQAQMWRGLLKTGMVLHRLAPPMPMVHSFVKRVPTTISPYTGVIDIYFYTPPSYDARSRDERFPVVVNFHGGGFTIGTPMDDSRWSTMIVKNANAIVASVDYRLAPEFPFPTAVEDGVDAVLYLVAQADELGIDRTKIALSGFSAGANLAITVPLRLDEERKRQQETLKRVDCNVIFSIAWYPPTDYRLTRIQRRATNVKSGAGLLSILTSLFDEAYIYPSGCRSSPYISPAAATDEQLRRALPKHVSIYTCEYDDLHDEGKKFATRIQHESIGKLVRHRMIEGVPHGWDKAPNPLWPPWKTDELYSQAVEELRVAFDGDMAIVQAEDENTSIISHDTIRKHVSMPI